MATQKNKKQKLLDRGFYPIPNHIMKIESIPPIIRLVYAVIAKNANPNTLEWTTTIPQLMAEAGCGRSTIIRARDVCVKHRLLKWSSVRGPKGHVRIRLYVPSGRQTSRTGIPNIPDRDVYDEHKHPGPGCLTPTHIGTLDHYDPEKVQEDDDPASSSLRQTTTKTAVNGNGKDKTKGKQEVPAFANEVLSIWHQTDAQKTTYDSRRYQLLADTFKAFAIEQIAEDQSLSSSQIQNNFITYWYAVICKVKDSPFLRGETHHNFPGATFDWTLTHMSRIADGYYDKKKRRTK